MSNNAATNGQFPPYPAAIALLVLLAAIGRLDPEALTALSAAAGILTACKDLLKPNP